MILGTTGYQAVAAHLNKRHLERVEKIRLERWANRRKAKVVSVEDGVVWLDLTGGIPRVWVGPDGQVVHGGYTQEELLEIAARPEEFVQKEFEP